MGILKRRGLSDLSTGMRSVFYRFFVGVRFSLNNFVFVFT